MTSAGVVTANSYVTTSDRRFKKDIEVIENALDIVMKMKGVSVSCCLFSFL